MTEGRGTGVPKILNALKKNGSPEPIFHTDDDRSFFIVEIFIHTSFKTIEKITTPVTTPVDSNVGNLVKILETHGELSSAGLRKLLGLKNKSHFRKKYLQPSIKSGLIELTIPDKPNSRFQKYKLKRG